MNIILVHIGKDWPAHINVCIKQIRKYYNGELHLIINRCNYKNLSPGQHHGTITKSYFIEDLQNYSLNQDFEKANFLTDFWKVTFQRLIFLEILMKQRNLTDVVHIENDVLIYENPLNLLSKFKKFSNRILLTPIGKDYISVAYSFIPTWRELSKLNLSLIELMKTGTQAIKTNSGIDFVNEMIMISLIYKKNHDIIELLPILPYHNNGSNNFEKFQCLFDGASWGQWIGGTPVNDKPWAGNHHYVGEEILKGNYDIQWKHGKPLVLYKNDGSLYPLMNLHIHSKKLELYAT